MLRREERRAVKACLRLLPLLALVPVDALMGGLSLRRAEMTPHPRGLIGGSVEEQVQFVKMRLRQTSDATGAWIMAKKEAILTEEEIYAQKVRKFARSIDQVLGATLSGFVGPWIIGWIFGTATGFKGNGLRAAMGNGVSTGTSWGLMSAAFCGVEVLSRECRGGTVDKWNNMVGACSAGCVGNWGKGPGMMASGCMNFAAMSYILDLLMNRNKDPFEEAIRDPKSVEKNMLTKEQTNAKKD